MRISLLRRLEALEIINKPREPKRILITYTEPYNFWDVTHAKVENQTIERKGDFNDYQTLFDLKQEAHEVARTIIKQPKWKGAVILVYVNVVLKDGADHGSEYTYQGEIPKDISNTHLCKYERLRMAYQRILNKEDNADELLSTQEAC